MYPHYYPSKGVVMQSIVFRFPDTFGKSVCSAGVTSWTQTRTSFLANVMDGLHVESIGMETPHTLLGDQLFSARPQHKEYLYGHTHKGKGKGNGTKDN